MTSYNSPYDDEESEDGIWYAYRTGSLDLADNRALLAAGDLSVPLVYLLGTRRGWFQPSYPSYVIDDDRSVRRVLVAPGRLDAQTRIPTPIDDEVARSYAVRETRVRLHQARFRGLLLPPYRERCAICRLREVRLLDAAHIVPDRDAEGVAAVRNGVALCTIHHRAFDANLIGISPEYGVRVSQRLLEDDDGPMLDILKAAHGTWIELPRRPANRPEREFLAQRYATFASA
jgi:putative restriction endonuclease